LSDGRSKSKLACGYESRLEIFRSQFRKMSGEADNYFGEDLMKKVRLLITGVGVGLCLCAIAKADDDQVPAISKPATRVIVRRVIVVSGQGDRVIYVRPAYSLHSTVRPDRAFHTLTTQQNRRRDTETATIRDGQNHTAQMTETGRNGGKKQVDQRNPNDAKSGDHETGLKQETGVKQPENNSGALDRLTVQAQKEQATRLAEPTNLDR
jgi:hypothetical protein